MAENGHSENGAAEKRKAEDGANGETGAKREKVRLVLLVCDNCTPSPPSRPSPPSPCSSCSPQLEGGTLLFSGATDWKLVGRKSGDLAKSTTTQWKPVRLEALKDEK